MGWTSEPRDTLVYSKARALEANNVFAPRNHLELLSESEAVVVLSVSKAIGRVLGEGPWVEDGATPR